MGPGEGAEGFWELQEGEKGWVGRFMSRQGEEFWITLCLCWLQPPAELITGGVELEWGQGQDHHSGSQINSLLWV